MIAYHGRQETKDVYLARVQAHRQADEIIKGKYWVGGKGCAVGCTVHGSDHAAYEIELGIPRALARLEDGLFERLPNDVAMAWPERFLAAIRPGADLALVWHRFIIWMLGDAQYGTLRLCDPKAADATRSVIALYQRELDGEKVERKEWYSAADAARTASAAAAAAARTASAAAAAYAAAAAADAAYAAAAAAAARSAHCARMADKLIELLGDAP
jgi:hypothetical protein